MCYTCLEKATKELNDYLLNTLQKTLDMKLLFQTFLRKK